MYLILDASWGMSLVVSLAIAFDLSYLWIYHKEKKEQTKFKSKKESEKEGEDDGEDILSLCLKLIVYTAKYCGSNGIDEVIRVKIRKFIIKNDSKNLSSRLDDLDKLFILASNTEISANDIYPLCENIKRKQIFSQNKSWFDSRYSFLDILFSIVYRTGNYNPILQRISQLLKIEFFFDHQKMEYDKRYSTNGSKDKEQENNKKTGKTASQFINLTLKLLVEAMKVDRSKMVCEFDVIKAFILKHDKENFQKRVSEVKKSLNYEYVEVQVEEICTYIYERFRQDYPKREEILKILVELIYADETCTNIEYNFLKKVADMLKVSKTSFDFMRMKFENRKNKNKRQNNKQENRQQSHSQNGSNQSDKNQNKSRPKYTSELEKAYAALGIDKDASDKEIRASWRNLIRVNHPDLMESKGTEAVMKATVRTQEINKAFEIVKASRGMK